MPTRKLLILITTLLLFISLSSIEDLPGDTIKSHPLIKNLCVISNLDSIVRTYDKVYTPGEFSKIMIKLRRILIYMEVWIIKDDSK